VSRVLLVAAAILAAVAVWTAASLPPSRETLTRPWADATVAGVLHIHTNRSDGRGSMDDIAAVAARAGLAFVVFTDHGDATRPQEAPSYRSGVLCIDGVEISTTGGHYLALGLQGRAPYPLGGEPRDVVEDVQRLGGFGIAAHPDSPKPALAWNDWDAGMEGIELVNPDSSWREHLYRGGWASRVRLVNALASYPFRAPETIGHLLTNSSAARRRWVALNAARRVVGIAGVDAHAKLELLGGDPGESRYSLPLPGYEPAFRALSVHVAPVEPLTGDAALDARRVLDAIRGGRLYTAIDAWATPPAFEMTATNASGTAVPGEQLGPSGPTSIRVRHNGPSGYLTTVFRGDEPVERDRPEPDFSVEVGAGDGVYRVEVRDPRHPNGPPWITSNPIHVQVMAAPVPRSLPPASGHADLFDGRSTAGWTTEADPSSLSAIEAVSGVRGPELRVRYGLSGGEDAGQFAGVAVAVPNGIFDYDRVSFAIRGERPMRLSLQARAPAGNMQPERWQRSIYVDAAETERTVMFADMRRVGAARTLQPSPNDVRDILFIVDTTNTAPGQSGRIWLSRVRLER
jgi:hypothetical protein